MSNEQAVKIDLDFMVLLQEGTPAGYAYNLMTNDMPRMIITYQNNGQIQFAKWLQDALDQINERKSMTIFDEQYFFIMSYADIAARFTTYTKAQILARFIP
jgi:hypothetical protein